MKKKQSNHIRRKNSRRNEEKVWDVLEELKQMDPATEEEMHELMAIQRRAQQDTLIRKNDDEQ